MRRIALISEHASPLAILGGEDGGGQNVYVGELAKSLAALGAEIDIFTRRDSDRVPERAEWTNGVRIFYVPAGPPHHVPKEELLPYMDEFTERVVDLMRERRYDLVHANFFMSGLVATEVKRRLGVPFVVTFHALGKVRRQHQAEADRFPDERFAIEDRIVQEANHLIAECPQDEEDLIRLYDADPRSISIVPAGFDPREFWPIGKELARVALGLPADERVILQLGRMVPRKGTATVVQAFARLLRDHGIRARLVIVGGESEDPDPTLTPELGRLSRMAAEEGVEENVTFVGRRGRDALRWYYGAADVFVTTPWYEPFGMTSVEAMACGTPVVGSNVGGIKFTVRDGETGYLVSPRDPQALAKRIAHLLSHPGVLEAFSRQATRRARDLFTWDHVARDVAHVYEKVLLEQHPASREAAARLATVEKNFDEAIAALETGRRLLAGSVLRAAEALAGCLRSGGKVLVCGNGGSAADAQHFAAELVGRFKIGDRPPLAVIALGTDAAVTTAWSNDRSFDEVFGRQVEALARPGDALLGLSTSGRSANMVRAFEAADVAGVTSVALLGNDGGRLRDLSDVSVVVPSSNTQRIQEVHGLLLHILCELVEDALTVSATPRETDMVQRAAARKRRRDAQVIHLEAGDVGAGG